VKKEGENIFNPIYKTLRGIPKIEGIWVNFRLSGEGNNIKARIKGE
jgi:hypothetical protein